MIMEREGLQQVCKYSTRTGSKLPENPHIHEVRENKKIMDNITDAIGNTPLVRLNNIPKKDGVKCEICKF